MWWCILTIRWALIHPWHTFTKRLTIDHASPTAAKGTSAYANRHRWALNVNYRLSSADQRKQTSVYRFCLQQTSESLPFPFAANKWKLPISVSSFVRVYIDGHVCWHNKRRLPFIACRPRKTNLWRACNLTIGGIHQSVFDERLEMISSLDFLQFTIHKRDSAKSTTQKHDPENLSEFWFCLAGNIIIKYYNIIIIYM